ncbi:MAG: isoprenylcysteine carboxylmethyltransferase family protein [Candidatus Eremiobacteraeota bacterium]|nr:isoprenylcysteine carboxylmethyltransferase family protein [Candidatus Eremiobacteraeota bacterium]MCW5868518.1 isoprenylcysteine carboxylmethyltransferase family protein [Candidatus Eremiobacteraeota bacterium]
MQRIGDFLFRQRGLLVALLALYGLFHARPTAVGLCHGLSWALLGEALRLWAIGYSGEPTRGQVLEAPQLVTAGPYAYLRNPLYVGNLLNSLGVLTASFFPWDIPRILVLWLSVVCLYLFLGSHEEKFLGRLFGAEYEDYRRQVPAWWPTRQGYPRPNGQFCPRRSLRFERTSLVWWCLIWLVLGVKGWFYGS